MRRARETHYWDAPAVAHLRVEGHARIGAGDLLHRAHHARHPGVVVAHEALCFGTPARQIRRQIARPEDDWQHHELIRDHATADQVGIAVVELRDRGGHARPDAVVDRLGHQADRAGVVVALQVAPHLVVRVAEPLRVLRRA